MTLELLSKPGKGVCFLPCYEIRKQTQLPKSKYSTARVTAENGCHTCEYMWTCTYAYVTETNLHLEFGWGWDQTSETVHWRWDSKVWMENSVLSLWTAKHSLCHASQNSWINSKNILLFFILSLKPCLLGFIVSAVSLKRCHKKIYEDVA